jgi:2,3-bisphosphoglycerate-dependent phosphoglycerate mutase
MQLYMIRHGQSENNAIYAQTRSSEGRLVDPGLTDIGHQQAKIVAEFLTRENHPEVEGDHWDSHNNRGFELTHLYSSLMLRAVTTGMYISEAVGLPLVGWETIHEWGGMFANDPESGERIPAPGANRAFFAEHYPRFSLPDSLGEEGWWNNRPYEPPLETLKRAAHFLNELLARHSGDDRVAIVTHGGFADSLLKVLLRQWPLYLGDDSEMALDVEKPADFLTHAPHEMWFRLNNTAITRLDFFPERFVVVYMNRVDFLPPELVT